MDARVVSGTAGREALTFLLATDGCVYLNGGPVNLLSEDRAL